MKNNFSEDDSKVFTFLPHNLLFLIWLSQQNANGPIKGNSVITNESTTMYVITKIQIPSWQRQSRLSCTFRVSTDFQKTRTHQVLIRSGLFPSLHLPKLPLLPTPSTSRQEAAGKGSDVAGPQRTRHVVPNYKNLLIADAGPCSSRRDNESTWMVSDNRGHGFPKSHVGPTRGCGVDREIFSLSLFLATWEIRTLSIFPYWWRRCVSVMGITGPPNGMCVLHTLPTETKVAGLIFSGDIGSRTAA